MNSNKMTNIQYIVSDLDGTITGEFFHMDPYTLKILNTFQIKSNYKLTIATGRLDTMTKYYIDKLKIKLPVISCNGALVRDPVTWKILYKKSISKKIVKKIVQEMKNANIDVNIYTTSKVYGEYNSLRIKSILRYNKKQETKYLINYEILKDVLECLDYDEEVLKILVSFRNNDEYNKAQEIIKKYHNLYMSCSNNTIMDIVNGAVNKGTAVKKIFDNLNVDLQSVIAYGDNENDIKMFKTVGYSAAIGGAVPELKAVASEVIDTLENKGVAKHIVKNFLR